MIGRLRRAGDDAEHAARLADRSLFGRAEGLQIHASTEDASRAGQGPDADVTALVKLIERGGDCLGGGFIDRVAHLGSGDRDRVGSGLEQASHGRQNEARSASGDECIAAVEQHR